MNMIAAQEIKRRGIKAVEQMALKGPVYILKNNKPKYVVLTEADYEQMGNDLAEARLASSLADLKAKRFSRGTAQDLMREIRRDQ